MITTKVFRVLDRMTDMGVICTEIDNTPDMKSSKILEKNGFWVNQDYPLILFTFLGDDPYMTTYDPYKFNDRTRTVSAHYINSNFYKLNDGDTINVEEILKNKFV